MTLLQDFSAGYFIAPEVEVRAFNGGNAAVPHDLYAELEYQVGYPVYAAVSGVRYRLRAEHGLPADTLALPQDRFPRPHHEGDAVLVERPGSWGGRFR
ncbi:hypothetical protein [Haloferax larsenii]|uniref:Uncharacterized protein n=1 Tax=Haloferax larsenii TaxID=302484 RepID=A0A1H7N3P1_HALLR|nr:hypothetical protein [Haloferax larsenii]SEL18192.1 hypothetical protein SAMN04488691_103184 [Haloferax larsenii]